MGPNFLRLALDAARPAPRALPMTTPADRNFENYKNTERKALEILRALQAVTPKKADIELALLVALFELHQGSLPGDAIQKIINGHLSILVPHFTRPATPPPRPLKTPTKPTPRPPTGQAPVI